MKADSNCSLPGFIVNITDPIFFSLSEKDSLAKNYCNYFPTYSKIFYPFPVL